MLSDQDDVWLPEKVEKSIKTLKEKKCRFCIWRFRSSRPKLKYNILFFFLVILCC